jgi:hypothetical protein
MTQAVITPGSASWRVKYNDGTELCMYKEDGSESAYKEIEWEKATEVTFESQLYKTSFDVHPNRLPPNTQLSLRSRVFMSFTNSKNKVRCYILLISKKDQPVPESTIWALYWFPDGTTHTCTEFDCAEVREYGIPNKKMPDRGIPQHHGEVGINVDANLTK